LIGEIRDEETASLAFKAAATGHLVLSTVHANGATEVIGRLLNLGIDKDSLRENLRFSAAQRLVPKLCKDCSTLAPSDIAMAAISEVPHQLKSSTATFRIKSESGCCKCHGGIIGRVPAIEYLTKTKIMTYLAGCDGGTKLVQSLQDAAHELAARGDIDVREVKAIG
jgi:type II secretory ATPase GspE/PulE/Tfp pilus assembly ATPase PilB-like protein